MKVEVSEEGARSAPFVGAVVARRLFVIGASMMNGSRVSETWGVLAPRDFSYTRLRREVVARPVDCFFCTERPTPPSVLSLRTEALEGYSDDR